MLFPIPVVTIFWMEQLGCSVAEVMWLQAAFSAAAVAAEFPSGYLADRVGHRISLLVGAAFALVGWVLYATAQRFADVVLVEVVLGCGAAFTSGADSALLYRALAARGRDHEYLRWESRARAAMQTAEAASSAAGGALYATAVRLPFWMQLPVAAASLATAAATREPPRPTDARRDDHLRAAVHLVRHTLWRHARLRTTVGLYTTFSIASFLMVWLVQPYLRAADVPLAWFGPIWAAANGWLAAVTLVAHRVTATLGMRRTLLACCALVPAGWIGMGAIAAPWGVVAYLALMTLRGIQGPLLVTALQRDAPDEDRAGVLSLAHLCFRLAAVVLGPPIGLLVDRIGLQPTLVLVGTAGGVVALLALVAFLRAHRPA